MLKAKDFRAQARAALKGKWVQAIIAGLIASLLGGGIFYGGYTGGGSGDSVKESLSDFSIEVLITALVVVLVVAAVGLLIGSLVGLGYAKFNLALFENEKVSFKMIFSEKNRYKDCFCLYLLQIVYITTGTICFVIPGLIAFYANIMGPYIMAENPELSAREALKKSREMMKGNKWRLFCLSFSFILWDILATLTFGIGHLFLRPYVETAGAAFYRELKNN